MRLFQVLSAGQQPLAGWLVTRLASCGLRLSPCRLSLFLPSPVVVITILLSVCLSCSCALISSPDCPICLSWFWLPLISLSSRALSHTQIELKSAAKVSAWFPSPPSAPLLCSAFFQYQICFLSSLSRLSCSIGHFARCSLLFLFSLWLPTAANHQSRQSLDNGAARESSCGNNRCGHVTVVARTRRARSNQSERTNEQRANLRDEQLLCEGFALSQSELSYLRCLLKLLPTRAIRVAEKLPTLLHSQQQLSQI